jgi:error-prone DNA polymerase
MRLLRDRLAARRVLTAADLARRPAGQVVEVAGLVVVRQAPPTAKGHLFITLEDETGLMNLIIRPDLYEKRRAVLHGATFLLVKGLTQAQQSSGQRSGGANSLLVQAVTALENGIAASNGPL